jgi:hypothetical protein
VLALIATLRDRPADARAHLQKAIDLDLSESHLRGRTEAVYFWALVQSGEDAAALEWLEKATPYLPHLGKPSLLGGWYLLVFLTEGLGWLGRRDEVAALRPRTEAALALGLVTASGQLFRTAAGIAAAAQGDWTAAQEHFDVALEQAKAGCLIAEPTVRYWNADMLLARGEPCDHERARELLTAAADGYARLGMAGFERRARQRLETV